MMTIRPDPTLLERARREAKRRGLIPDTPKSYRAPPTPNFRGAARALQAMRGADNSTLEVMLSGPSETGKTFAALWYLDCFMRTYPKAQATIIRKVRADLLGTATQIYRETLARPEFGVVPYGGDDPEFFRYPLGGQVWIGGMDRPGKALSGARDIIIVNQAEELELEDWETLTTRVTGRAGHSPYGAIIGDCNPSHKMHWILRRGALKLLVSRHVDNPTLYDDAGNLTERGINTMRVLRSLTGTRSKRLFKGEWASAEGLIYEAEWLDLTEGGVAAKPGDAGNVTDLAEYVKDAGPIFWYADDGYSAGSAPDSGGKDPETGEFVANAHPRVFLLAQMKPDGHIDIFQEHYRCLRLTDEHIADVKALGYPPPDWVSHGPGAAEFRGRLQAADLPAIQCTARVDTSTQELRSSLAADDNGWRRIRVHPRCKHLRFEFSAYTVKKGTDEPLKQFDHGPDALRGGNWVGRFER